MVFPAIRFLGTSCLPFPLHHGEGGFKREKSSQISSLQPLSPLLYKENRSK